MVFQNYRPQKTFEDIKYSVKLDAIDLKYELQQKKKELCYLQTDRIIFACRSKYEMILNIINFIKRSDFDAEAFTFVQERLHDYLNRHLGKPQSNVVEQVLADDAWMYVLMNPDQIPMFPDYYELNQLYQIHPEYLPHA